MNTMADVNGKDHLVRQDKETKLNGYDNDGFRCQERSGDDEESGTDEDRLRIVVTENGHRPETDSYRHNGHVHEESNGHPANVNGTAVIVLEETEQSTMDDSNKSDNSQKPLDTRLHHYVPVEDIDRKTLNGSDGCRVTIPEDAVISFTTGRVKVKKGGLNSAQVTNERESIPLETMLPSYEDEQKVGLGEKAELATHKNGLWSEGHDYTNSAGPFGNSGKLNGSSKSVEEVGLPVNNHRKCLSSDAISETSSEQKSTGEKLYFTEDNRKLCPGWRRVFVCGLILIILAVALLLGVLAATGILLAESESKNTRYESGHSLPSIDSLSSAGHSFRQRPSSKVPEKFQPVPVTNASGEVGAVSPLPPTTVTSKVPVLNDSSHSQTIVPNALVGEFTIIDENFTEDLKDNSSHGYASLATHLETELRRIFKGNGGVFQELRILNFSPGSIKVKLAVIWASDHDTILAERAEEILKSYLRKKNNLLLAFPVDLNSIHFKDVFDECQVQKGGCSYKCEWNYDMLAKTCLCEDNMVLLTDGKSCGPKPSTSTVEKPSIQDTSPASHLTSVTTPMAVTTFTETTSHVQLSDNITTTPLPTVIINTITTIMDLFHNLSSTEKSLATETTGSLTSASEIKPPSPTTETTTTSEQSTTNSSVTTNPVQFTEKQTTKMPVVDNADNRSISENATTTESTAFLDLSQPTTASPETTTIMLGKSDDSAVLTVNPVVIEDHNQSTTSLSTTAGVTETTTTTDEGTLGYHIKNGTIEIYTLNESTDFMTETVPVESSGIMDVLNDTVITQNSTDTMPTTDEKFKGSILDYQNLKTDSIPGIGDTTESITHAISIEFINYENFTEAPNATETEPDDLNNGTTLNSQLFRNTTELTATESPKGITTKESITESLNFTTLNSFSELATLNSLDEGTTMPPFLTSTASIKPIIPQFNRTPEVRAFDNDTDFGENYTTELNFEFNSTDTMILAESTEITAVVDNSSVTESNLKNISSTMLINIDEATIITTENPVTTPEIMSFNTAMNNSLSSSQIVTTLSTEATVPILTNNTELTVMNMSSMATTVPAFIQPLVTSGNASLESIENTTYIKINIETSTLTNNEFLDVTFLFNNSNDFELSTELQEHNETNINVTEIFSENTTVINLENVTAETTVIFINDSNTTIVTNDTDIMQTENKTKTPFILLDGTTMTETFPTLNFDNETATESSNINNTVLYSDSDSLNATNDILETENLTLSAITTEVFLTDSDNQTLEFFNETTTLFTIINDNETISDLLYESNTTVFDSNITTPETYTTVADDLLTPIYLNDTELYTTTQPTNMAENLTTVDYDNTLISEEFNFTHTSLVSDSTFEGMLSTVLPPMNDSLLNSTLFENMDNITTTDGFYALNGTTVADGIECREDQFLCEPLNKCINDTFMCDGIQDCPDGHDEFECKETCHKNFMCTNSSNCIMSEARCDGIWDCENGTDEDNCKPTECAKHEVMCLDGSKCIRPGDICDWKYDCADRSDEVGCIERTTCESGGRFFCNDGLCIPWSLKCDGEPDCKEKEDEGNCTCLNDEFRCNDGKCLKSSSRCDGHQDCSDAGDEMGCVNVDSEHMVSTYEPYSGTWGLLCAEDWNLDDGQHLCQELGFGHVIKIDKVHVSFNGTWMAMRRENLTASSLWTERVSFAESCTSNLAAFVECQKFACGEYTGLLHRRRRRDVVSSSSTQLPFIGYASTFHTNKGCLSEILTPIWLITSAECLLSINKQPFNGSDWYVRTNIGRNIEVDQAQNHEVLRIILHPHSSKFRSLAIRDYDVALIRLKHALVFVSDKIGAICLSEEQVKPGITCFSGVLGSEKPRAPPPQELAIKSIALQIVEKEHCNRVEHFNSTINQRMLCTQSSEGHTICDNDEGTPLMCLTGINKWFLAGMLTYQRFCDVYSKHPAVFSNLFSMRKFLDQVTGQKQYEIPYNSNIYVIIPPTTPSPTTPETTTMAMTTTTNMTELALSETTLSTTLDLENTTATEFEYFRENSTMISIDELGRKETETTTEPGGFTTLFSNVTELFDSEVALKHYGIELSSNLTLGDSDTEIHEILMNKTMHDDVMSLPNDTFINYEDNSTTSNYFNNFTQFDNESLTTVETATGLFDFGNISMDFQDGMVVANESTLPYENTTFVSHNFTSLYMNESELLMNVTMPIDEPLVLNNNDSIVSSLITPDGENITESQLLTSVFNNSSEASQPIILNANISHSLHLTSAINNTKADNSSTLIIGEMLGRMESELLVSNETIELNSSTPTPDVNLGRSELPFPFDRLSKLNETNENGSLPLKQPAFNETKLVELKLSDSPRTSEKLGRSEPLIFAFEDYSVISEITNNKSSSADQAFNKSLDWSQPLIFGFNESALNQPTTSFTESTEINQPLKPLFNKSEIVNQPIITSENSSWNLSQPLGATFNESWELNKSVMYLFNESLLMNQPLMNNESLLINQPLINNQSLLINQPLINNESLLINQPLMKNESLLINQPLINNQSLLINQPLINNESLLINQPLMKNESLLINQPLINNESFLINPPINNKSVLINPSPISETFTNNQPLISLTTKFETHSSATDSPTGTLENSNTEMSSKHPLSDSTILRNTGMQTDMGPTMKGLRMTTEPATTNLPNEGKTDTFTFEMDALPNKDIAISIFNESSGIRFESLVMPDRDKNVLPQKTKGTENFSGNILTNVPPITTNVFTDTTLPVFGSSPLSTIGNPYFSTTEKNGFEPKDQTGVLPEKTETENFSGNIFTNVPPITTNVFTDTTLPVFGNSPSSTIGNPYFSTTEKNGFEQPKVQTGSTSWNVPGWPIKDTTPYIPVTDATTFIPGKEYNSEIPLPDDWMMDAHLVSEKLTVQESSVFNINECGLWDVNPHIKNISDNERFYMKWPAIGFMQMVGQPKLCAAVAISSKFVITSLNCLSFSTNHCTKLIAISEMKSKCFWINTEWEPQMPSAFLPRAQLRRDLNPEKWAYVGGLYHADIPDGGTQNHLVAEIISYPYRNTPKVFYEHNIALVRLKDAIRNDNYSKNACLPENEIKLEQECYTAGWTKNVSNKDDVKQFYSVPVSLIPAEVCNSTAYYKGELLDSLICGNYTHDSIQPCQMDLGAPLLCLKENKQWELQGILSFPGLCEWTQPTVFNSIASVRKWITDTVSSYKYDTKSHLSL